MNRIKISEKYQPLFTAKTRYFVLTGGRGSGKSFGAALFLLNLTYEEGHKILYSRYTLTSAYASIIPEFQEKMDIMGTSNDFQIKKDEIINLTTGSSILFKGIRTTSGNQTASLKSLTGITTFVLDEAEELVDEDVFNKINFSVRKKDKQNRIILIMNPATKEHWIYRRFFDSMGVEGGHNGTKGNTTYIHTTYKDNLDNLPEDYLADIFEMKMRRPDKYEHFMLGGWLEKAEGVIFTNWTVGDFILTERSCYGQDFGFSEDPTTLVHVSMDLGGKKLYVKEVFSGKGMNASQIASKNRHFAGRGLIIADSSDPRLIKDIKSKGVNIRAVKNKNVKGAILSGIALLQDFQIVVDPKSNGIIKELNNYVWQTSDKPVDDHNHFLDAIRYAAMKLYSGKNHGVYHLW